LLEQGKTEESSLHLIRALSIGHSTKIGPCIGLALVVLGAIRIAQSHDEANKKALYKGRRTLEHALQFAEIEAETRAEARLSLAKTALLEENLDEAQQITLQSLEESRRFELSWLVARAQYVLGSILAAKKQIEEAERYFEQALRMFRKAGMRLEYARTLLSYGEFLLQNEDEKQRGSSYVQEARKIFSECKAALDLRMAEQALAKCGNVIEV
jgi:tetratricopeptide (TPR) repeat protein